MPVLAGWAVLAGLGGSGPALTGNARGLLVVCAWQIGMFAVFFGLSWLCSRASLDDLLCRWRGGVRPIVLGLGYSVALRLAVGLVVAIGAVILFLATRGALPAADGDNTLLRPEVESLVDVKALRQDPLYFWLSATVVSFGLGGLREELWRAGFLAGLAALWPGRFGSRGGRILGSAVAALLFGFAHLRMGMMAVIMTTLLGFGLGLIMVWHRSIWPAVIAHGAFNATTMALLPFLLEKVPQFRP